MLTFLIRTCNDEFDTISIVNANSQKEAIQILFKEPDFDGEDLLSCDRIDTHSKGVVYIGTEHTSL